MGRQRGKGPLVLVVWALVVWALVVWVLAVQAARRGVAERAWLALVAAEESRFPCVHRL